MMALISLEKLKFQTKFPTTSINKKLFHHILIQNFESMRNYPFNWDELTDSRVVVDLDVVLVVVDLDVDVDVLS